VGTVYGVGEMSGVKEKGNIVGEIEQGLCFKFDCFLIAPAFSLGGN
jgi:hypothetical protein